MILSRTIFDHFSIIAPLYERFIPAGSCLKLLELLDLSPQHCVLDAGGGTGRIAKILREYVEHIVVVDISLGMLKEARNKCDLLSVNAPTEYLPFSDKCFDRVLMVDAFHHVADQVKTAHELWRVLKPGGWILLEEPDIRTFAVKLMAVGEKILLMRSHFLTPARMAGLFDSSSVQINIEAENYNTWTVIKR
jgi:ubiquinone/menaquinone biosynthesis C-methylase UbiE